MAHSHQRNRRGGTALWIRAACVVALLGCSAQSSPSSTPVSAVKPSPTVSNGSVLAKVRQRGRIVVGVKFDVPLFGFKNDAGDLEGFDIEIAKIVASAIFDTKNADAASRIQFVEALSKDRESYLQRGTVDIVVSTYTITESRKQFVDFAGPYYIAGQDILARSADVSSGRIAGVGSLNGKKVCAVTGSTSLANLIAAAPQADTSFSAERYPQCFAALQAGTVDAMTTDDVILLGLIQSSAGKYALTGNPFHTEPYGVGIPKGETELRALINRALDTAFVDGRWAEAFRSTVGVVGASAPAPPQIQDDVDIR